MRRSGIGRPPGSAPFSRTRSGHCEQGWKRHHDRNTSIDSVGGPAEAVARGAEGAQTRPDPARGFPTLRPQADPRRASARTRGNDLPRARLRSRNAVPQRSRHLRALLAGGAGQPYARDPHPQQHGLRRPRLQYGRVDHHRRSLFRRALQSERRRAHRLSHGEHGLRAGEDARRRDDRRHAVPQQAEGGVHARRSRAARRHDEQAAIALQSHQYVEQIEKIRIKETAFLELVSEISTRSISSAILVQVVEGNDQDRSTPSGRPSSCTTPPPAPCSRACPRAAKSAKSASRAISASPARCSPPARA